MPIYEYACGACGHSFEEWQKMSDPPVKTCPKCKKKKVDKLISQTAFQLKGGGWYKDLYSSSKGGVTAKSGENSGADKSGGGGEKSGGGGESSSSGKDTSSAPSSGSSGSANASAKPAKSESSKDSAKKTTAKKSEARAA